MDWKEMVVRAQESYEQSKGRSQINEAGCVYCGVSLADRHIYTYMCDGCRPFQLQLQYRAANAVYTATRRGELPKLADLQCVDCGKPAKCWDHRDYDKPLQIEPTCRSCNKKRGPAKADSITQRRQP